MAAILVALVIGGAATAAFLWPYGMAYVLVGSPFGASALALLAAFVTVAYRSRFWHSSPNSAPAPTAVAKNDR